jgi:hypothetical protein
MYSQNALDHYWWEPGAEWVPNVYKFYKSLEIGDNYSEVFTPDIIEKAEGLYAYTLDNEKMLDYEDFRVSLGLDPEAAEVPVNTFFTWPLIYKGFDYDLPFKNLLPSSSSSSSSGSGSKLGTADEGAEIPEEVSTSIIDKMMRSKVITILAIGMVLALSVFAVMHTFFFFKGRW